MLNPLKMQKKAAYRIFWNWLKARKVVELVCWLRIGCHVLHVGVVCGDGFGAACVGEEEAARFDEKFIQPLDESDNTGCDNDIAKIIGEFNPGWDTEQDYDGCFKKAVEFAKVILVNHFNAVAGILRATELVKADMEKCDGEVLVLSKFAPWKNAVIDSGYKYVVYPSNRGDCD